MKEMYFICGQIWFVGSTVSENVWVKGVNLMFGVVLMIMSYYGQE